MALQIESYDDSVSPCRREVEAPTVPQPATLQAAIDLLVAPIPISLSWLHESPCGGAFLGAKDPAIGLEIRLLRPADAEAITQAASRPAMHFFEPKSPGQQARAMVFWARNLFVHLRIQTVTETGLQEPCKHRWAFEPAYANWIRRRIGGRPVEIIA